MKTKILLLLFCSFYLANANAFILNISTIDESCMPGNDGAINISPSGGSAPYTYSWSSLLPPSSSISGLSAGVYHVTVTDAVAATQTASITISAAAGPTVATTIIGPSCPGRQNGSILVNISAGTPPYTYLWSNSTTTSNLSNLAAGVYGLTVVDANGCISASSLTVADPFPQPMAMTVSQSGDTLISDEAGANYRWLDCDLNYSAIAGGTAQKFLASISGNYAVEVTRSSCVDTTNCVNLTLVGRIETASKDEQLTIYPNPSRGNFSINISPSSLNESFRIMSLDGKVVYEGRFTKLKTTLDLSSSEKGIYLFQFRNEHRKLLLMD